jgi:Zn-dependent peptidase ImmA (M78 family)
MSVATATRQAEALLGELGERTAPVDVLKIAARLGLRVVEAQLGEDVSGALVANPKRAAILVNSEHHDNRKRFTIAHELGHHVLRHQFEEGGHVHVDRGNYISLRGKRASEGVDPKEVEANWFAASLLMPTALLRERAARLGARALHDQHVDQLAEEFEVSTQAMTIRLTNLGLL